MVFASSVMISWAGGRNWWARREGMKMMGEGDEISDSNMTRLSQ
jgi:hypothetical protein